MKLGELALSANWAFGLIIEDDQVKAQAVNAARQYASYGAIRSLQPDPVADAAKSIALDITEETALSDGEWSVIKPLALLYVERENARALEASRGMGVDVYGRDVNTIEADIRQYETLDLPRLAFACMPETI